MGNEGTDPKNVKLVIYLIGLGTHKESHPSNYWNSNKDSLYKRMTARKCTCLREGVTKM